MEIHLFPKINHTCACAHVCVDFRDAITADLGLGQEALGGWAVNRGSDKRRRAQQGKTNCPQRDS